MRVLPCFFLFLIACLVSFVFTGSNNRADEDEWQQFKVTYGKTYKTAAEETTRRSHYFANKKLVNNHNILYKEGRATYSLKLNHLADRTAEEVVSGRITHEDLVVESTKSTEDEKEAIDVLVNSGKENLPKYFDWREKTNFKPVLDQGNCNSCWAFAVNGAIESRYTMRTNKTISLSEQYLVDCAEATPGRNTIRKTNIGCGTGKISDAFVYIRNKGIPTSKSYGEYVGIKRHCRQTRKFKGVAVKEYRQGFGGKEDYLKFALVDQGPVVIAIDAKNESLILYSDGIHYNQACNENNLTHAVLLVGYGTEEGQDYWLVKNSWGETWGELGYGKLARNRNNNCGVASGAVYPIVEINESKDEEDDYSSGLTLQSSYILSSAVVFHVWNAVHQI